MSEFSSMRGVVINGREQIGRTHQREDGTFETLDLKDVRPGEIVTVVTSEGAQELVKMETEEHDSALANWTLGTKAVRLALSEPTGNGADFIHHGIVLKERLGLQVSYPASEHPNVVYGLGVIGSIAGLRPAETPQTQAATTNH